jgi:hypothetical protein
LFTILGGESCLDEWVMGFGRYDLVKMVVLPGFTTSSLDVFENGFLTVLADFDEFESVLDFDIASFQLFLEESVTAIIVLHKSVWKIVWSQPNRWH